MSQLALAAVALMVAAFGLYMRHAIVTLNKDLRVLLDRQVELRERLAGIDREQAALRTYMEALQTTGDAHG